MTERNKTLMQRWLDEVWTEAREATIDELMAADALIHGLADDGGDMRGAGAFKAFWRQFRMAFPDVRAEIGQIIGEADLTACRFACMGTHTGDGLGLPPTHRRIRVTAMVMCRWRDGRIVEGWNEFDAMSLFKQIGAPPAGKAKV